MGHDWEENWGQEPLPAPARDGILPLFSMERKGPDRFFPFWLAASQPHAAYDIISAAIVIPAK